jgi:tetratricopeptide (TPR) repeat protein
MPRNTTNFYACGPTSAQGRYKEAEEGFGKALAIRRKVLGEEHPDTAGSYNNLALNRITQGKYQEAEEGSRKALAIFREALGMEHPNTAASYHNLVGAAGVPVGR